VLKADNHLGAKKRERPIVIVDDDEGSGFQLMLRGPFQTGIELPTPP